MNEQPHTMAAATKYTHRHIETIALVRMRMSSPSIQSPNVFVGIKSDRKNRESKIMNKHTEFLLLDEGYFACHDLFAALVLFCIISAFGYADFPYRLLLFVEVLFERLDNNRANSQH